MHIPDGLLEPRVYLPLAGVSIAAVGLASARARAELEDRPGALPLTGVMAAFLFAAQMVNFPVAPGVSGHLLGGVLAGILLGPYCATMAVTAVFILQAFLLQDGGVAALGANTFNMGLIATFLGYGLYRALRGLGGERPVALPAAAFLASFSAVMLGALAAAVEIAASRPELRSRGFFALMLGLHAAIGAGEGAITVGVLAYVGRVRPDLLALDRTRGDGPQRSPWPLTWQMLAAAAVIGFLLYRFSSELPDGLTAALEESGWREPPAAAAEPPR